jgi:hypothetical protein
MLLAIWTMLLMIVLPVRMVMRRVIVSPTRAKIVTVLFAVANPRHARNRTDGPVRSGFRPRPVNHRERRERGIRAQRL